MTPEEITMSYHGFFGRVQNFNPFIHKEGKNMVGPRPIGELVRSILKLLFHSLVAAGEFFDCDGIRLVIGES